MASVLDSLLHGFRQAASGLPDSRRGSNKRYAVADAASCALATFFFQAPSFLEFQRRMQEQASRSIRSRRISRRRRTNSSLSGLRQAVTSRVCPGSAPLGGTQCRIEIST